MVEEVIEAVGTGVATMCEDEVSSLSRRLLLTLQYCLQSQLVQHLFSQEEDVGLSGICDSLIFFFLDTFICVLKFI